MALVLVSALVACDRYRPPTDCTNWRYGPKDEPVPGVLPTEYPRTESGWKLGSLRDDDPAIRNSIQNQCGQIGAAVDLAWGVTKGRDDVLIAVLDSGIKWRDAGSMADLAHNAYINVGEARPAGAPADGDANGDGRFDISDFGPIPDRNGNGVADPEDLILDPAFSDGVDDDGNGYVDDISGWDFLYGDNNPLDTVDYGHGTGEAKDSTADDNGQRDVGSCPDCRFVPVRVGDSFVTDGGRFAAGTLLALDSGADIVQEALGVTSNPRQAQQAIDAAYERGVLVVASMADEESKHANLPAALEHTMPVNSVTQRKHLLGGQDGWMALNGCTNWGPITWVSMPSSSCSSEATGLSSGIAGLIESAARDAGIARNLANPAGPGGNVLSANELKQLFAANADDIDFGTPTATDPANNYARKCASCIDFFPTESFPSRKGWDQVHGFGRVNAYEAVRLVKAKRIPPEADITSPLWFDVRGTSGSVAVTGRVAARFADSYGYRVEWAPGASPPAYPATDTWHVAATQSGLRSPRSGTLATLDLAQLAAALPGGGTGVPVDANGKPDEDRYAVRIRIVVTGKGGTADGLEGVHQKQIYVHDDPDLVAGYPKRIAGLSASSPVFADLDGRGGQELIVASSDGEVHAYTASGGELPGWPVRTAVSPWWPSGSPTARAAGIAPVRSAVMVGAPAIGDLDGNGSEDVVVTDLDGNVWAWNASGARLPGFGGAGLGGGASPAHIDPAYSRDDPAAQDERNRTKPGFYSSPALGQLDDDPELEIVAAALDRHVYAFDHDGTPVDGWPVMLVDPAKVAAVDPTSHKVTFSDPNTQPGGELVATPALHDFDGDGRDEVVIGSQEEYEEPLNAGDSTVQGLIAQQGDVGNSRLYVLSPDGTNAENPDRSAAHPDDQAYLPGWPTKLGMILLDVLPVIGNGVTTQVAIGDVKPSSPGMEIVATSAAGPVYVFRADGTSAYGTGTGGLDNPALWAGGLGGEQNGRYGANRSSTDLIVTASAFSGPAVGKLDADGTADFTAPTAGFTRLIDLSATESQSPSDDQVLAWKGGDTGSALPGFPQVTADIGFFVSPAIADLDGDGRNETITGNGLAVLSAHEADGSRPAGWPKLQGEWVVGTPGLGDWDGDGLAEIAHVRRDGVLLVWRTRQPASTLTEWPRFGGNDRNTGVTGGG
ncbi:MAG: hypothetical protein KF703_09045 [Actinobacteria bacterium]|nr:hypothetical protein [Actinomycetota bacterium]